LGAMLYFLLCRVPPFSGDSLLDTIRQVQDQVPTSPRKLNHQIPADLEAICLKCLEKNPERRYQSASELQSDLIRYCDGLPVMARRPGRVDRLIAWCRRRPAVAGLTAALVLLTFASSLVLGILLARSNQLKELAERHAVQAIAERDRARQALDAMTSGLATEQVLGQRELTPQQRRFLQQTVEWYRDLTATSSESEALDPTDQLWLARAEERLSQLLSRLGDMDGALSAVDHSIFLLEQLFAHDSRPEVIDELAKSLHRKDAILTNSGRHEEALPVIESAVEIARLGVKAEPTNPLARSRLSNIIGNLGSRYRNLNRLEDSVLAQLESLALKRQLIQEQPDDMEFERSLGISLMNLGNLLTQMSRMDEADEVLQEALTHIRCVTIWHLSRETWLDSVSVAGTMIELRTMRNKAYFRHGNWSNKTHLPHTTSANWLNRCRRGPRHWLPSRDLSLVLKCWKNLPRSRLRRSQLSPTFLPIEFYWPMDNQVGARFCSRNNATLRLASDSIRLSKFSKACWQHKQKLLSRPSS